MKRKQSSKFKEEKLDVRSEEMLLYRRLLTSFFWLTPGWWPTIPPPGGAYSPCPTHPHCFLCTALGEAWWDCWANMSVTSILKKKKEFFDIDVGWLSQFSSFLCSFVGIIKIASLCWRSTLYLDIIMIETSQGREESHSFDDWDVFHLKV